MADDLRTFPPHPRGDAARAAPLLDAARAAGSTVDATALAAAIAQPWASVVLLGAATPEQLASNVVAVRRPLSGAILESLAVLREDPGSYGRRRASLPWT